MVAVFVFGKLGKVKGDAREIFVRRVPSDLDRDDNKEEFDTFLVKYWTRSPNNVLFKLSDEKPVAIKGRLSVENGQIYIIAELINDI